MTGILLRLLEINLIAAGMSCLFYFLRLTFSRSSKSVRLLLWGMVGIRLLLPVSFFSHLASERTSVDISGMEIEQEVIEQEVIERQLTELDQENNASFPASVPSSPLVLADIIIGRERLLVTVWLSGILLLSFFTFFEYYDLKRRLRISYVLQDNILICDEISTPFVQGLFRPQIILPSSTDPQAFSYIIKHEKEHIKRKDLWWLAGGYALVCIHWFNPFVWLDFFLLRADIEYACDEQTVQNFSSSEKQAYAITLVHSATGFYHPFVIHFGRAHSVKRRIQEMSRINRRSNFASACLIVFSLFLSGCAFYVPLADPGESLPFSSVEGESILLSETDSLETSLEAVDEQVIQNSEENPWSFRAELVEGHTLEGGERIDYDNPPEYNFYGGEWPSNAEPFTLYDKGNLEEFDQGGYYNEYGYYIIPAYEGYFIMSPDGSWTYNPVTKEHMAIWEYSEEKDPKNGYEYKPWEDIMVDGRFPWEY